MEELYRGEFLCLRREGRWEFVERVNARCAVVMVAVTGQNELLLVEQTRIPQGGKVIELPAGLVGDEEDEESLEVAASRELIEETGYRASGWMPLVEGPPSPGLARENLHFLLAQDVIQVGQGGGVDGEDITVLRVPLAKAADFLRAKAQAGMIVDPKIYIGLYFLQMGATA